MKKNGKVALIMLTLGVLVGCGSASVDNSKDSIQTETVEEVAEVEDTVDEEVDKEAEANNYYEQGINDLFGTEGSIDFESAYNNFEKAVELGKVEANFYLGAMVQLYNYPEFNEEKARSYYEACSEIPIGKIQIVMDDYDENNKEETRAILKKIIEEGCVEGYWGLAKIDYDEGNYTSYAENLNKVLEGKNQIYVGDAMCYLGSLYHFQEGVEHDLNMTKEYYEKSAKLNNPWALEFLGDMYRNGDGVEANGEKALDYYSKSSNLRNSSAMTSIGYMYHFAELVEADYDKAIEYYTKAADLNYATAMNNLAYMYYKQEGVEQNSAKVLEWYEKSVELGNTSAMANLGAIYFYGEIVEQDYEKALEYFDMAAELGHEKAKEDAEYVRSVMGQ